MLSTVMIVIPCVARWAAAVPPRAPVAASLGSNLCVPLEIRGRTRIMRRHGTRAGDWIRGEFLADAPSRPAAFRK